MNESGESLRGRISAKGTDALGEVAEAVLENPLLTQVLQRAFGARDAAFQARDTAIRNLHLATEAELDRLTRRLRATSERLEAVEDKLDQLSADVAAIRRALESREPEAPSGEPS
jgi:septal ring factor EnvC (AmiA/AmiB activator)